MLLLYPVFRNTSIFKRSLPKSPLVGGDTAAGQCDLSSGKSLSASGFDRMTAASSACTV